MVSDHLIIRVGILTASDRCHKKVYEDLSGKRLLDILAKPSYEVVAYQIVPDDKEIISRKLSHFADSLRLDLVLTTGGTGLGPRDVTPEATQSVCTRMVPGLAEYMRAESLKITPMAALSRGTSGIRGKTLIVNLPGHPKAVGECMQWLIPLLPHALDTIRGAGHEGELKHEKII